MHPKKTPSIKEFDSSQVTQDLSFDEEEDCFGRGEEAPPSCVLLTDYESDSLADISFDRQDSIESVVVASPPSKQQHQQQKQQQEARQKGCLITRSSAKRSLHSVQFSHVQIRTYAMCVGDNPAVSLGVPISLDWRVLSEETTALEAYDPVHPRGKVEAELVIPADERVEMVRRAGATTQDIRQAVQLVNATKMEREKTLDTLQNAASEEFLEKLRRSVWNATLRRKSKKMQRAQLKELLLQDSKRISLVSPAC